MDKIVFPLNPYIEALMYIVVVFGVAAFDR